MDIPLLNRKENIIITAIDLIDECGIQAVSTREIARRQGVSESTIFKHFKTKNDLILAVLDHFCQFDKDIFKTVKLRQMRPDEAILFFIDSYATYYENYPAITAITQVFDITHYDKSLAPKIKEIYGLRSGFILQMVQAGQNQFIFKKELDPVCLTDMITGTFREICLKWRMSGCTYSLRKLTLDAIKVIINNLRADRGDWRVVND